MHDPVFSLRTFVGPGVAGGPTVVRVETTAPTEEAMLRAARATGVAVTAFLFPTDDPGADRAIRYCTPVLAIGACGHATLAAAEVVFATTRAARVTFAAPHGRLPAERRDDGAIAMRYPRFPTEPCPAPAGTLDALGMDRCVTASYCARRPSSWRPRRTWCARCARTSRGSRPAVGTSRRWW